MSVTIFETWDEKEKDSQISFTGTPDKMIEHITDHWNVLQRLDKDNCFASDFFYLSQDEFIPHFSKKRNCRGALFYQHGENTPIKNPIYFAYNKNPSFRYKKKTDEKGKLYVGQEPYVSIPNKRFPNDITLLPITPDTTIHRDTYHLLRAYMEMEPTKGTLQEICAKITPTEPPILTDSHRMFQAFHEQRCT